MECFGEILDMVRRQSPVVHSITNYVTVNDCANIILAAGGSPIMADDAAEVEQIVGLSSALVLNIGTLNTRTAASMGVAHNHLARIFSWRRNAEQKNGQLIIRCKLQ